jgi:hypothetical protein
MKTETHEYRGYEIVITNNGWTYQAAVYPTNATLPKVDWENKPIEAAGVQMALMEAKSRINAVLSGVSA